MQRSGYRAHFWFQKLKVLRWLQSSFSEIISNNMHPYINADIAGIHLIYVAVQVSSLHPTLFQQFSTFRASFLFSFNHSRNFDDIFRCPYDATRYKMIPNHDTQTFDDPADSFLEFAPCTSYQQSLHFLNKIMHEMHVGKFRIGVKTQEIRAMNDYSS